MSKNKNKTLDFDSALAYAGSTVKGLRSDLAALFSKGSCNMQECTSAEEFVRWEEYAKKLSVAQLRYAIDDCVKAAKAIPAREGYYHDQASCFRSELNRRERRK